ncbi:hypothetical protein HDU76_003079, partial [Blyttiomyces sp. JEL0837]
MAILDIHQRRREWSQTTSELTIILMAAMAFIWIVSLCVFIGRKRHRGAAVRNSVMTGVQSAASYFAVFFLFADWTFFASPCFLKLWLLTLSGITWCICVILRASRFYIRFRFNQAKLLGLFDHTATFAPPQTAFDVDDILHIHSHNANAGFAISFAGGLDPTGVGGSRGESHGMLNDEKVVTGMTTPLSQSHGAISSTPRDSVAMSVTPTTARKKSAGSALKEEIAGSRSYTIEGVESICFSGGSVGGAGSGGGDEGTVISTDKKTGDVASVGFQDGGSTVTGNRKFRFRRQNVASGMTIASFPRWIDKLTDEWLCRRKDMLPDIAFYKVLCAGVAVTLVYLSLFQVFTTNYRIYPTMDANACGLSDREYVLLWMVSAVYLLIAGPIILSLLIGARDSNYLSFDITATLIVGYPTNAHRAKGRTLLHNMESFRQVLDDASLFESFKGFVAADLSIENALFWEALKELNRQTDRSVAQYILSDNTTPKSTLARHGKGIPSLRKTLYMIHSKTTAGNSSSQSLANTSANINPFKFSSNKALDDEIDGGLGRCGSSGGGGSGGGTGAVAGGGSGANNAGVKSSPKLLSIAMPVSRSGSSAKDSISAIEVFGLDEKGSQIYESKFGGGGGPNEGVTGLVLTDSVLSGNPNVINPVTSVESGTGVTNSGLPTIKSVEETDGSMANVNVGLSKSSSASSSPPIPSPPPLNGQILDQPIQASPFSSAQQLSTPTIPSSSSTSIQVISTSETPATSNQPTNSSSQVHPHPRSNSIPRVPMSPMTAKRQSSISKRGGGNIGGENITGIPTYPASPLSKVVSLSGIESSVDLLENVGPNFGGTTEIAEVAYSTIATPTTMGQGKTIGGGGIGIPQSQSQPQITNMITTTMTPTSSSNVNLQQQQPPPQPTAPTTTTSSSPPPQQHQRHPSNASDTPSFNLLLMKR